MNRYELRKRLSGHLFLAAIFNHSDGEYCVARGQGAGMIQLGTMIAAPRTTEYVPWRNRWPKGFLPDDAAVMRQQLAAEIATVKAGLGDVVVCLSVAGFEAEHVVMEAQAFQEAGGDFVELNVHGGLQPWADQGYLQGMALPRYRQRLVVWVERLAALEIPLVVKFNTHLDVDYEQACHDLAHLSVWGYHFNVRDEAAKQPKYNFVEMIRPCVKGVLLCSGYAWTAEAVRRLLALGVDSVGLAQPAMDDPGFIARLAKEI